MKKKILFVCMGNICRSPAAEEIFRQKTSASGWSDLYEIDSAGTYGGHRGELPDPRMREAASRRGYLLTHRARPVADSDFHKYDMLLVMDERNYDDLERLAFTLEEKARIYRLSEFSGNDSYDHIPDPYYGGRESFESVLDMLEECCAGLLEFTRPDRK